MQHLAWSGDLIKFWKLADDEISSLTNFIPPQTHSLFIRRRYDEVDSVLALAFNDWFQRMSPKPEQVMEKSIFNFFYLTNDSTRCRNKMKICRWSEGNRPRLTRKRKIISADILSPAREKLIVNPNAAGARQNLYVTDPRRETSQ